MTRTETQKLQLALKQARVTRLTIEKRLRSRNREVLRALIANDDRKAFAAKGREADELRERDRISILIRRIELELASQGHLPSPDLELVAIRAPGLLTVAAQAIPNSEMGTKA